MKQSLKETYIYEMLQIYKEAEKNNDLQKCKRIRLFFNSQNINIDDISTAERKPQKPSK